MTTTPQVRLGAIIYPNSATRKSGKTEDCRAIPRRAPNLPLAAFVARKLGIVPTWPNVQTIRLAIESEADLSGVSDFLAAEVILKAAKEWTRFPEYSCPAEWEKRLIARVNTVDRFWFEDARWREKDAYTEFRRELAQ